MKKLNSVKNNWIFDWILIKIHKKSFSDLVYSSPCQELQIHKPKIFPWIDIFLILHTIEPAALTYPWSSSSSSSSYVLPISLPLSSKFIMYCKIADALPCALYGSYANKKIYFADAKKYFAFLLMAVHVIESVKLITINLAHDGTTRFYLGEVHFSNSVVQNYFNSALAISFTGCVWLFVRFYWLNKYGGRHFAFFHVYFGKPHEVQAIFNLPLFKFERHVLNARKLFKISTVIKNFLLTFYTIPILLNLRSSYDNLGSYLT